jgi:6-phosphogluconolactonase
MEVHVSPDPAALARDAAARIVDAAADAVAARDRFCLAVSGGSTPGTMFAALAALGALAGGDTSRPPVRWDRWHLFQVDERVAPDGDPARNATGLRAALVDVVPIPPDHVHLMDVGAADLDAAARAYGERLGSVCGGALDVVHLGLGDDGHTASWPPGDPVVDRADDVAVVGPYRGQRRMTLTPGPVNRARSVLWLVSGADKAPLVRRLLDGDRSLPASRVDTARAVLCADGDAAAQLSGP